jgi:hypothetical protein
MLQDGKPKILTCKQQRKYNISGVLLTAFFIAGLSGRHHQLLCGNDVVRSTASISTTKDPYFIPLKTKRRPLYLKTQSVPRSKHFSSRL